MAFLLLHNYTDFINFTVPQLIAPDEAQTPVRFEPLDVNNVHPPQK